jgi:hypothetical protein
VEVQVVAAEVGEPGGGEPHAADPAQHQGVARDLHDDGGDPGPGHGGQELVQRRRLRGGPDAGEGRLRGGAVGGAAAGARLHRADQPGAQPCGGEARLDQIGGRGLAVGAGDAQHGQLPARLAVHAVGNEAEHRARVVDDADRQARGRGRLPAGRIGEDGDGATPCGVRGEPRAVCPGARQGCVQVTSAHLTRGQGDAGDHLIGAAANGDGGAHEIAQVGECQGVGLRSVPRGPGYRPGVCRGHGAPIYRWAPGGLRTSVRPPAAGRRRQATAGAPAGVGVGDRDVRVQGLCGSSGPVNWKSGRGFPEGTTPLAVRAYRRMSAKTGAATWPPSASLLGRSRSTATTY